MPVSQQITDTLRNGFSLLEKSAQDEVSGFITGCQHESGLFVSRSNRPDFYYSLFGAWMAGALELSLPLDKLGRYFRQQEPAPEGSVDRYASLLTRHLVLNGKSEKPGIFSLIFSLSGKGTQVGIPYRAFLFSLAYDALYDPGMASRLLARLPLAFCRLTAGSPCSFHAAILMARLTSGMKVHRERNDLMTFFREGKGFVAFNHLDESDLLSTAVALFALKRAGHDLRMVAPATGRGPTAATLSAVGRLCQRPLHHPVVEQRADPVKAWSGMVSGTHAATAPR